MHISSKVRSSHPTHTLYAGAVVVNGIIASYEETGSDGNSCVMLVHAFAALAPHGIRDEADVLPYRAFVPCISAHVNSRAGMHLVVNHDEGRPR